MRNDLSTYIESEEARRKQNWRIDFGEEAKIETESKISTMLHLTSENLLAVASY